MPNGSLFDRLPEPRGRARTLLFEGMRVVAREGDSVAAALMSAGIVATRWTPVVPRGPFCMMGLCFECLVEIDGVGNIQACQVLVREGMVVKRMTGAPGAGA